MPVVDKSEKDAPRNPEVLTRKLPKGKPPDQDIADFVVEGATLQALALQKWGSELFSGAEGGKVDITSLVVSLDGLTDRVKRGSLADAESVLITQVAVLNTLFANLLSRAHQSKYVENLERFLRLGFKAQAQCRATCETLAVLKNPPVFARQANISNGPQQVNNGPVVNGTPARAGISEVPQTKLLEAAVDGERVDRATAEAPGSSDQALAAVGAVDGAADGGRKGARLPERVPRRRASEGPSVRKGVQRLDPTAPGRARATRPRVK